MHCFSPVPFHPNSPLYCLMFSLCVSGCHSPGLCSAALSGNRPVWQESQMLILFAPRDAKHVYMHPNTDSRTCISKQASITLPSLFSYCGSPEAVNHYRGH